LIITDRGEPAHELLLMYLLDSDVVSALVHGPTVVTRNVRDFAPMGVELLDPAAGK
jgi:predicted nucleic acid-binding protein